MLVRQEGYVDCFLSSDSNCISHGGHAVPKFHYSSQARTPLGPVYPGGMMNLMTVYIPRNNTPYLHSMSEQKYLLTYSIEIKRKVPP